MKTPTQHTPGPWKVKIVQEDYTTFTLLNGWPESVEQAWANARLIAAAPDLLAACQAALERLEASQPPVHGATETVCKQLRSAIEKANQQ